MCKRINRWSRYRDQNSRKIQFLCFLFLFFQIATTYIFGLFRSYAGDAICDLRVATGQGGVLYAVSSWRTPGRTNSSIYPTPKPEALPPRTNRQEGFGSRRRKVIARDWGLTGYAPRRTRGARVLHQDQGTPTRIRVRDSSFWLPTSSTSPTKLFHNYASTSFFFEFTINNDSIKLRRVQIIVRRQLQITKSPL